MIDSMIKEDAKSDWLNLVNKHKKRQKGLPELSKLNTNAGNVELNTNMFNKMSSAGMMSNNPISGPHGDSVSSEGLAETMIKEENMKREETITLYYPELEVTDVTTGKVYRGSYYEPDEYETKDVTLYDYEYTVDKQRVIEFLQDLPELIVEHNLTDLSELSFDKYIVDHFDNLVQEYEEQLLSEFEDEASTDARNNYNFEDYFNYEPEYDPYDDYLESKTVVKEQLDDSFDMSMRTLL